VRVNHFCTDSSFGERQTVIMYRSSCSVMGVVLMLRAEKLGSSLVTPTVVKASSRVIMSDLYSSSVLQSLRSLELDAPLWRVGTSTVPDGLGRSPSCARRFFRAAAVLLVTTLPLEAGTGVLVLVQLLWPTRNLPVRSFWLAVCVFVGAVPGWLESFWRRACERTLRRVSSSRVMVLMDVMNWKPPAVAVAGAPMMAFVAAAGQDRCPWIYPLGLSFRMPGSQDSRRVFALAGNVLIAAAFFDTRRGRSKIEDQSTPDMVYGYGSCRGS